MKRLMAAAALVLVLWAGSLSAAAGSLWDDSAGSMFADRKARNVGDLVTLIIVERSEASQAARTTTAKDGEVSIGPGLGLFQDVIPLISARGGDNLTAGGTTTRGSSLTTKMTTRVVEVLPGDILRIEGRQNIIVNGEEQEIVVSGLVRRQDISRDNTVLSTYVADASISFKGAGVLGDKQEPGLLTRLFNWLF
ncbi:MAG: flagellar basal body L-ring protein FlgH [Limnochordia bacterium]